MSDAPSEVRIEDAAGRPAALTPDGIDRILADFRGWLEDLTSGGRQPLESIPTPGADGPRSGEPIDFYTLVAQFTALRHEVNLQTKAARAAVEQNAKLVEKRPGHDESLRPLVKLILNVADTISASCRQLEKLRVEVEPLIKELACPRLLEPPHHAYKWREFASALARVVWRKLPGQNELEAWADDAWQRDALRANTTDAAIDQLNRYFQGIADGYAMSVRRVERVLPEFGLEPIECVGRPFDPDTMEVVELGDGGPGGIVLEEICRGYRWNGTVFRCAQVKVAR